MTRIETLSSNSKLPISLTDLIVASATKQSAVGNLLDRECFFIIECRICCNLFRTVTTFVNHKENVCMKAAADAETDPPEVQNGASEPILCEKCGRQFENKTMKLRHDEYFHSENTPIKSQASYINENTKTTTTTTAGHQLNISDLRKKLSPSFDKQLSDVKRQNNIGMQCQQCTKWFPCAEDLKLHLLSSCPNMVQNKIPIVEKNIEQAKSVAKRIGATNLKCDFCDNEFKFERTKQKHMQRFHADKLHAPKVSTVSKIFNCVQCHRMYSDENSLKRHIEAIHPSEPEIQPGSERLEVSDAQPVSKKRREPSEDKQKSRSLTSNISQNSASNSSAKTLNLDEQNGVEMNDNISIYCDEDNMQCLICLVRQPNLEVLRNHIRTEHAAVSPVESEKAIENGETETNDEIEGVTGIQFPTFDWTGDFGFDHETTNEKAENGKECFECRICGKTFNDSIEFNTHVALPHKIAIRSALD